MLKKCILIFIALIFKLSSFSQDITDSLKKVINSKAHDTSRLAALYTIIDYVSEEDGEFYVNEMLALSQKGINNNIENVILLKRFLSFRSEAYYTKGVFFSNKNESDSALIFYEKALNEFVKLKNDPMIAYTLMSEAIIYTTRGHYPLAINLLNKAIEIHKKNNNAEGLGDVYLHFGRLYHIQKDYRNADIYFTYAYKEFEKCQYGSGIVESLYKLGITKFDLKQFQESINYLNRSSQKLKEFGLSETSDEQQFVFSARGFIAIQKNQLDSAIYFFNEAVNLALQQNSIFGLDTRYNNIAEVYFRKKQFNKAKEYASKALEIAQKTKNVDSQYKTTNFLSRVYKALGNYKDAYEMQYLCFMLYDSIQNLKIKKGILNEQFKYQYEKKELLSKIEYDRKLKEFRFENERKNTKKNTWILILIICFIILAICSFFIYKYHKQKAIIKTQNINILKQKMLLTQMNPHFIFNSINSIQNYILQKKEKDAYNYLAKFSKLIRKVLHNSDKSQIALYEEIDLIKIYIEIEQLRFDNSFEYEIYIDDSVKEQEIFIPPMLIQPYIENAIWHGIMHLEGIRKGKLSVSFSVTDQLLKIRVQDNGVGREVSKSYKKDTEHKPVAMKLSQKRLEIISNLFKEKNITIDIQDVYDASKNVVGTSVELYLPLNLQLKEYDEN